MTGDVETIRAKLAETKTNLDEDSLNEVCAQIEQLDDGADLLPDLFALMKESTIRFWHSRRDRRCARKLHRARLRKESARIAV